MQCFISFYNLLKMKIFNSILFFLLLSLFVSGQSAGSWYKVRFTDKGQSPYSISRPAEFLSQRSIERRLSQQIPLNESDLPVNPEYIQAVLKTGAKIVYTSKWLNLIIIETQDNNIVNNLKQNRFISSIEPANQYFIKKQQSKKKMFFETEAIEKFNPRLQVRSPKDSHLMDYGAAFNQVSMINIDEMHALGFTGKGVTMAVIDGGFNSADVMVAFDSIRMGGQVLGTRDFVQPGNNVYGTSMSSHGTMVLSTIAANMPGQIIGTAPKATFWLLRSEDVLAEYLMEEYYWVNAAEFADSVGADIINSSLGYTTFDNPSENHTYDDMDGNTTVVTIGADMAASKGILVVNSAGNSGDSQWHYIGAPADGDSVLTVGAVNQNGAYASFSSVGPTSDGRIKPDVTAQGQNTVVAIVPSGIAQGSGTSFSSPIIAGAAACLWQANPSYSNMELLNAIRMSGSLSSSPDNQKGWGIPDFMLANNLLTTTQYQMADPFQKLRVYPIPFSSNINIELESTKWLMVDLLITNSTGKVVSEMKGVEINKGLNLIVFNKIDRLPLGVYMVHITDGTFSVAHKLIK